MLTVSNANTAEAHTVENHYFTPSLEGTVLSSFLCVLLEIFLAYV